jgi:hypothetical protein
MPLPLFALVLWCAGLLVVLLDTPPDEFSLPMLALFVGSVVTTLAVIVGMLLRIPNPTTHSLYRDLDEG